MERKREYRLRTKETITEEERSRQRELNRIRQQRYTENKKRKLNDEDNIQTEPAKKALTRTEHKKMKLYWKEKKREQRANMTAQKKRRVRERERLRYAKLKLRTSNEAPFSPTTLPSTPQRSSSILSLSAQKQSAYRVKKVLPTSPNKFAQVMGHIIKNATPRKKALLKTAGISSPMKGNRLDYPNAIKETMATLKGKRQDRWQTVKRCLVMSLKSIKKARNFKQMSSETGIGYKFLRRYSKFSEIKDLDQLHRKKRQDCVDDDIIAKVHDHFASSSSFVPDKKAVNRKTMESKKVLDEPVSNVYKTFQEKNPDIHLSQSKFSKLRPANVQTTHHKRLYQSMCEYCTNPSLKREALNKVCDRVGITGCKIKGKSDLIGITTCPKQDGAEYYPMQCIRRDCEQCGVHKLDTYYEPLVNATHNEVVSWNYWTTVDYCRPGKTSSKRKTLLTNTTSVIELKNALKEDCKSLSTHLLNAHWQKNSFQVLSTHVPANSVVMHLDYSENYATFYQQEISSAHWMKNLVTVHPVVTFYNCPECGNSAHPVMDVLIFLSDDTTHDHHAVQTFMKETVRFLKEDREVQFHFIYEFTDGCSSQYKSRGPLADISFGATDFGVQRERHYFGSCHGKGPCDGAGGVVKTAARMAVIRGEAIITDARSMYTHLKSKVTRKAKIQNICNHSRREFFLICSVNRDRPERIIKTSVKGTRQLHSVRGITAGVICTRNLGCVCSNCLFGDGQACENDAYVEAWYVQQLNLQIPQVQQEPRGAGCCQQGTSIGERGTRRRGVRTRRGGRCVRTRSTDRDTRTSARGRGVRTSAEGQGLRTRGEGRGARTRGGGRGARTRGGGRGAKTRGEGVQRQTRQSSDSEEDSDVTEPGKSDARDPADSDADKSEPADSVSDARDSLSTNDHIVAHGDIPNPKDATSAQDFGAAETELMASSLLDQDDFTWYSNDASSFCSDVMSLSGLIESIIEDSDVNCFSMPLFDRSTSIESLSALDHTNTPSVARSIETDTARTSHLTVTAGTSPPTDTAETSLPTDEAETSLPTDEFDTSLPTDEAETSLPTDEAETSLPTDIAGSSLPTDEAETSLLTVTVGTSLPTDTAGTSFPTDEAETYHPTVTAGTSLPIDTVGTSLPTDTAGSSLPTDTAGTSFLTDEAETCHPTVTAGPISSLDDDRKYNVGSYISVKYKEHVLPAVVVDVPPTMQDLPDIGIWVQYFKNVGRNWTLEDCPYFIDFNNILKSIDTPNISCTGTRVYYKFNIL